MRSFRFLLSRRWILFLLVVLLLTYGAWWLGQWQFHRLEDRRESNNVVERNERSRTTPVANVLAPGRSVRSEDEWRKVTATGTYAVEDSVIVRYRTRDSTSGVDVVVPLVTLEGPALLVDRGWLRTDNSGSTDIDVPAPPQGEVTVTGWVRANAQGDSTAVSDLSVRAISSEQIGPAIDREVYTGFVELDTEDPAPAEQLSKVEMPDLGEGPHFFYGLQWWFFGALAIGGFLYLAYDEWRSPAKARHNRERTMTD